MNEYDKKIKDTQVLYKTLRGFYDRYMERKTALQDEGTLSDFSVREHTVNEWLYDLDNRLRAVERVLEISTGAEHEKSPEIPLAVNHLKQ